MQKFVFLIILLSFLAACSSNNADTNKFETASDNVVTPNHSEEQPKNDADLTTYFMKNNSTAEFKGEGNEYASYTLKTHHLYENYIATYEDNGGTVLERIYRISDEHISIIAKNEEAYEVKTPSLEELDAMPELEVYLATPLEVGTKFNGWNIISITETVKTDTQTFTDVIVIEKVDEQQTTQRKYFSKDFGEIKREFIIKMDGEESIITSTFVKLL